LLTTSAAFGGIAVAIWNRRTLARMRQEITSAATSQVSYKKDPSGANVPD
jgi:galactokinase